MEENMSDEDRENPIDSPDNAKRFKTDTGSMEKSEESSTSSNNTEQESASTSTDSGFPRNRSIRHRNYRNRSSTEEGTEEIRSNADDEDSAVPEEEVEAFNNLANLFTSSPSSSDSTVINDTDSDSNDEEPVVLKKSPPKHNWFAIPEVANRQIGYSSKFQSGELFRRRFYGSLHSVQRLELMYKLEEHEGCVNSLNFHPDGTLLASGSDDLKVAIWDWKIAKCVQKYDTKHKSNVFQSKFLNLSGDLHLATCARDGQVRIAQISREEGVRENRKLGTHRGPCHKLAILADQPHIILSAGEDAVVLSHDVRNSKAERIVTVKDPESIALYSIHGHPLKSHEFCVSGRDHYVRIYDQRKSDDPVGTYTPFKDISRTDIFRYHVTCAVYNHDGTQILGSYSDADIYLFDVNKPQEGEFLHRYEGHRNGATIKGVNFFGKNSEFVVSGSDCGYLYFWDRNTEAIVQWMLADDNGVVNCLEPHPTLPFICTSGLDWDIKFWVPSCEQAPAMQNLAETVKSNTKFKINGQSANDINESRMLWMLWRHLRNSNRIRTVIDDNNPNPLNPNNANSSSSNSSSSSSDNSDDDEDMDVPIGCAAS